MSSVPDDSNPCEASDLQLWNRFRAGDVEALAELLMRYRSELIRVAATGIAGGRQIEAAETESEAKDVFGELSYQCLRRGGEAPALEDPHRWLVAFTWNLARRVRRTERRRENHMVPLDALVADEVGIASTDLDTRVIRKATLEALGMALNRMTEAQRSAFLLVVCDELRIAEAADRLAMRPKGLAKALGKARGKLRRVPWLDDLLRGGG
jgi:RNA polymerase sigma factor (sigma-70 family)